MNRWYFVFISILFIFSCEDESIEEQSVYFGTSSVLLNGEQRNHEVRTKYSFSDEMFILISLDEFEANILRSELYFRKVELYTNSIQYLNSDYNNDCQILCTSFSTGYDDQAGDSYNILEDDQFEDWIIIDSLNVQTMEFRGRFQASFIRDDRIPKMDNYPDTLYFENGTFNGKILE